MAEGYSPRLYIYSTDDRMVPFTSVEKHISILKINPSFDVSVEKFSGSQHVQHERQDPERYWKAIENVWNRSRPIYSRL
jgi:hypothetical protein